MKNLFAILFFFISVTCYSQLPYLKLLDLPKETLTENNFKYDSSKNQYVLKKTNGWNTAANVMSTINGKTADVVPHKDDYYIIRQEGKEGVSYVSATFYNDNSFHEIQTWLAENDIEVIETNSGKLMIQKFNFEDLSIELRTETIAVSATTGKTGALAKTKDVSYNVYNYTIYTGIVPSSKWHDKQAKKQQKKDDKGKKKDINDLMF